MATIKNRKKCLNCGKFPVGCVRTEKGVFCDYGCSMAYVAPIPDLIKMGVIKRKLTRDEAANITEEVMRDFGDCSPDTRFMVAVMKAVDITSVVGDAR